MRFIIICIIVFLPLFAYSATLKAGVSYTVEEAREEAFSNVKTHINIQEYANFLYDKNIKSNVKALHKGKTLYKDRILTSFSDGEYAVVYKNNLKLGLYYNKNGELCYIDISDSNDYPRKTSTYNAKGVLISTSLEVSKDVQYIFDLNKKLITHWIGKNGYNEKGELFGTRN